MNTKIKTIINYTGFVFMIVSTILFYNHLFTASRNPKFFTIVYFDMFGEGQLELLIFTLAIPFIAFTIINHYYNLIKSIEVKEK